MAHVCISWWSFLFLTNHVAKSMRLLKKKHLTVFSVSDEVFI